MRISTIYLNYLRTLALNYINDLFNTCSGPVWVIGSDPTLDDYPDDFMADKVGIALHLAYVKFQTQYTYANELDRVKYLSTIPGYNDSTHLFGFPFYKRTVEESLPYHTDKTYCLNLRPFPPRGNIKDALNNIGREALRTMVYLSKHNQTNFFGDFGTCLHGGLFCATMMGFNEVHVIGAGMSTVNGADHFKSATPLDQEQRPNNPHFSDNAHEERLTSTKIILETMEEVGIKTYWHKSYSEISEQPA